MTDELSERMRSMVEHYQAEGDPLDVEEAVKDAENFCCDGVGGSCVSLMRRVLELEAELAKRDK